MLALDISRRLEKNKLNYSALEALIQRLAVGSVGFRADRLRKYIGETEVKNNKNRLAMIINQLAFGKDKKLKSFEQFKEILSKDIFGIVLTAHPTFGMTPKMMTDVAKLSTLTDDKGNKISASKLKKIIKEIFKTEQRPEKNITLDFEHKLSIEALKNLQNSISGFYKIIIQVSKKLYPNDFHKIRPKILSLHTWVGYDVDGRGDIFWNNSFSKRIKVKLEQLRIYSHKITLLQKKKNDKYVVTILKKIRNEIDSAIKHNTKIYEVFSDKDFFKKLDHLKSISKYMFENKNKLLTNDKILVEKLDDVIQHYVSLNTKPSKDICEDFLHLRTEIENFGLGLGRTQIRLNANQLNNAISKEIDLSGDPEDPSNKRTYLSAISKLIENANPVKINFGSILEENMNARRYFMVIKQILKYIDENQSIRFLIAECDYSLTVMTALYFSKIFDVEDKIDISPLFETERGLTNGHNVISTLLKNTHFRKYLNCRKKLSIQTGFSDAGRYIGQSAAVLYIENLQRKIAKNLAENNLPGIKLLIFNTHGESIGRGGHPMSLNDRLNYVSCEYTRKKLSSWGINLVQEMSFQGGDGYQYFMNHDLSFACVSRIAEFCLENKSQENNDPLYDSQDFGIEFVNTIKLFNTEIMDDPNYATLLNIFGSNITHSTGSRSVKRHVDGSFKALSFHPSQTRAIPQNTVLQQLGMLANTLGGVGKFLRKDLSKFQNYYNKSRRFRKIMDIVKYAFAFSDIEVLKAYIDCFDPGMWLSWSTRTVNSKRSENMVEVANLLEKFDVHWRLNKIYRKLHQEYMDIRNWVLGRKLNGRIAVGKGRVIEKEIRDELLLMHGIRVAIFHEIFLLSVRIPKFSDQAGTSRDEIIAKLIRFDVSGAVDNLRKIFPTDQAVKTVKSDFGESSDYINEANINYTEEERTIFKQMEALYECTRRVSTGINHFIGSVG